MTLSAAVMHVPDVPIRRALLADLLRGLGQQEMRDRLAKFTIVRDTRRDGVWPTARRAWMSAGDAGVTHHMVIQDDATPCRDFLAGVHCLIEAAPASPICLFDMSKATKDALAAGSNWVSRTSLSSALAIVMPVTMALDAIRWADAHVLPSLVHDDVRFSMYFQSQGIVVLGTAPSLVEHAGDESLVGNPRFLPGRKERRAAIFIGRNMSALSIDWAQTVASPTKGWSHSPSEYRQYLIKDGVDEAGAG